jgi:hypothetical protein
MKQFSLFTALLFVAIVALAISLLMSRAQSKRLASELTALQKNSVTNERFGEALVDQEIGISFILNLLGDRGKHLESLNFISTIDGGIRFRCHDLPLFDDMAVYEFRESYRTFAKGVRPDYEPKAICFLIERNSETVVDQLLANGELEGVVWANLRDTDYEQYFEITDNERNDSQYVIRRDGFHKLDEETIWEQDMVHAAEWVAILEEKPSSSFDIEDARKTLKDLKDGVLRKLPD